MNTLPTVFSYEQHEVRTILIDGNPWFVGKDVCEVLGISKYRDAIARLDDNERCPVWVDTPGGKQETNAINEPGLYRLIFRSDKPQAKAFQDWVYKEVLPSIRKTGGYSTNALPCKGEISPDVLADPRRLTLAIRGARAKHIYLQTEMALRYPERIHSSRLRIRGPKELEERILHVLRRHGPLSLNTLHHSYMKRWDAETIEKGVDTLIVSGQVVRLQTERGWTKYTVA